MTKKFSRESVDMIYDNAKKSGYNEGFIDGYEKCKQDILNKIKNL